MPAPVCRFAASRTPKLRGIEGSERDSTQDWVVPRGTVPLVSELEARVDEALTIARASEEGVREVGEMALDAARQARRAAEAAEASARAAATVQARPTEASGPAGPVTAGDPPPPPVAKASSGTVPPTAPPPGSDVELGTSALEESSELAELSAAEQGSSSDDEFKPEHQIEPQPRFEARFRRFSERADRVSARLRALQDHPSHPAGPSVAAARRRGDG
jgi:hypothetical protein